MIRRSAEERSAFVREQTKLAPAPFVPEVHVFTAPAVNAVWFETARWLDDDDADVPFWCVPWAGGQAVARYVLDHPELVRGASVVDFGCGGGVVAIAASRAGARVTAVDSDPLACEATRLAARANEVAVEVVLGDRVGDRLEGVDVVLAGDIWYETNPSARFRRWFERLAAHGVAIVTGDAGRGHAPRAATVLATYEVPTPFDLEAAPMRTARVLRL